MLFGLEARRSPRLLMECSIAFVLFRLVSRNESQDFIASHSAIAVDKSPHHSSLRKVGSASRNWPVEQHGSFRGIRFTCSTVWGNPAESALLERPLPLPAGHRSDRLPGS